MTRSRRHAGTGSPASDPERRSAQGRWKNPGNDTPAWVGHHSHSEMVEETQANSDNGEFDRSVREAVLR